MMLTPRSAWLPAAAFFILAGGLADGDSFGTTRHAVQQQTFQTKTDLVRIDVMAVSNGRALTGLMASDFEVLDNGVPQHVQLVTTTGGRVKVLLLLDVSGSIAWGTKMQRLVRASQALWQGLGPEDEGSVLTFADRLSLEARNVRDREVLGKTLLAASGHLAGQTALWDGLFVGLSLLGNDVDRSLVLVFSDGLDTASWCDARRVKEVVRRAQAVVYAVTVPPVPALSTQEEARIEDERFRRAIIRSRESFVPKDLKDVVELSGGELIRAGQGDGLTNTFVSVLEQFRSRYLLAYEPTGVRRDDGWHELRVQLKGRAGTVRARSGYYARVRTAAK